MATARPCGLRFACGAHKNTRSRQAKHARMDARPLCCFVLSQVRTRPCNNNLRTLSVSHSKHTGLKLDEVYANKMSSKKPPGPYRTVNHHRNRTPTHLKVLMTRLAGP